MANQKCFYSRFFLNCKLVEFESIVKQSHQVKSCDIEENCREASSCLQPHRLESWLPCQWEDANHSDSGTASSQDCLLWIEFLCNRGREEELCLCKSVALDSKLATIHSWFHRTLCFQAAIPDPLDETYDHEDELGGQFGRQCSQLPVQQLIQVWT